MIGKPDEGDAVTIRAGRDPGLLGLRRHARNPLIATRPGPAFCITHFPGSMIVTDLRNARLSVLLTFAGWQREPPADDH